MSAFGIPPHPRRTTGLALGLLAVVALTAFTEGVVRQLVTVGPAPPPPAPLPAYPGIAEATPAPIQQVAYARPKPRRVAAEDADEDAPPGTSPTDAVQAADQAAVPAAAQAATTEAPPDDAPAPGPPVSEDPPT